jgi:hypothetical protein
MAKKARPARTPPKSLPGIDFKVGGLKLIVSSPGERKNYNLQPGVTEYELWPFSTIEWVVDQSKYQARVIIQQSATSDIVAINSWHQDFSDAERAIALVSNSLNGIGDRRVYNIFAETIEVHTADIGGGTIVNVIEALGLIWSMQQA